jgi:ribosomal protein S27AE
MKIRPGRTRSLIGGIAALLVMIVGLVMMSSSGGVGGFLAPFMILWVIIGLAGATVSFYNAFSREGVPLYEIDLEADREGNARFCPQCGRPVERDARFCKYCGAPLGSESERASHGRE